jgi:aryl carrier-like protein
VATAKDLHAMIAQVSAFNRSTIMDAAGAGGLPQTTHARPNLPTPYVAPATAGERRLAEIWQVALGIEQVGANDNFFDLGGDSIIGIQLIARANEAGLQLSPDQLFEHQTIAELARELGPGEEEPAGPAPLPVTSYQRELLAAGPAAPYWSASWPLPAASGALASGELLAQALAAVTARHDALRTRFAPGPEGWSQVVGTAPPLPVREVELPGGSWAEREAAVSSVVTELHARLDPERGVALAAGVLSAADGELKQALLVAHAAVTDATSWRLLREEVRTACRQLAAGGAVELPPVTAPFAHWLAARVERARAEEPRPEAASWLAGPGAASRPAAAAGPATAAVTVRLAGEEAAALREEIPELHRLRVEELLVAALAETLAPAAGAPAPAIEVEMDGREAEALDLDLTRTVGCFTVVVPVRFEPPPAGAPGDELRAVKEELRRAFDLGLAVARRRDLSAPEGAITAAPTAAVRLGYLGDAEAAREGGETLPGMAVRAQVEGEAVRFEWRGGLAGRPAEVLAGEFLEALRDLIATCRSTSLGILTPSDFPDAGLSQEDLDRLFSPGVS